MDQSQTKSFLTSIIKYVCFNKKYFLILYIIVVIIIFLFILSMFRGPAFLTTRSGHYEMKFNHFSNVQNII